MTEIEKAIHNEIMNGLSNVEASKRIVTSTHGANPKCRNKLYTMFCQRCGRNMKKGGSGGSGPCKAFARNERWSGICEDGSVR